MIAKFKALPLDHPFKTAVLAVALCLVASVIVAATAIELRPLQNLNKQLDKQKNLLIVAGIPYTNKDVQDKFKSNFDVKYVNLPTGDIVSAPLDGYDDRAARSTPLCKPLSKGEDIASIGCRLDVKAVYAVKDANGNYSKVIVPMHGAGLWSTMWAFMAVDLDGNTVKGFKFYDQAETPGLGGEVDNPRWIAQWADKKLFDGDGNIAIAVVKGGASGNSEIDALSGATLTSNGVQYLVQYWSKQFQPFLNKLSQGVLNNG